MRRHSLLLLSVLALLLAACPPGPAGPPGPPGPPGPAAELVFDSAATPQLVGTFFPPNRVILDEGGVRFGLVVGRGALGGIVWPVYFDDDSCGGDGGQAWVEEKAFHANLIPDGYLKGDDVYLPSLGAAASFTPRSQMEDDGSCTDLFPDPPSTTGFQASVVKSVAGFVPPFVLG